MEGNSLGHQLMKVENQSVVMQDDVRCVYSILFLHPTTPQEQPGDCSLKSLDVHWKKGCFRTKRPSGPRLSHCQHLAKDKLQRWISRWRVFPKWGTSRLLQSICKSTKKAGILPKTRATHGGIARSWPGILAKPHGKPPLSLKISWQIDLSLTLRLSGSPGLNPCIYCTPPRGFILRKT